MIRIVDILIRCLSHVGDNEGLRLLRGHVDRAGFSVSSASILGRTFLAICCLPFFAALLMIVLSLRRFGQVATFLVPFALVLLIRLGRYLLTLIVCRVCRYGIVI